VLKAKAKEMEKGFVEKMRAAFAGGGPTTSAGGPGAVA